MEAPYRGAEDAGSGRIAPKRVKKCQFLNSSSTLCASVLNTAHVTNRDWKIHKLNCVRPTEADEQSNQPETRSFAFSRSALLAPLD